MSKKIAFNLKPATKENTPNPDQWVESRSGEGTKRLTIDLPASLHSRVKAACAQRGIAMNDEIRQLLEAHFPIQNEASPR